MDYFRALPPCFFFLPRSLFTSVEEEWVPKDALFLYSSIAFNYSAPTLTFPRHPYLWKWLDRGLVKGKREVCSHLAVLIIRRIEWRNTHQSSREEDPDPAWSVKPHLISRGKWQASTLLKNRNFRLGDSSELPWNLKVVQFLMPFRFYGLSLIYFF